MRSATALNRVDTRATAASVEGGSSSRMAESVSLGKDMTSIGIPRILEICGTGHGRKGFINQPSTSLEKLAQRAAAQLEKVPKKRRFSTYIDGESPGKRGRQYVGGRNIDGGPNILRLSRIATIAFDKKIDSIELKIL